MSTPIRMPQLGESVAEGTLGRWLKAEGDWVAKDEPLAEIITDKVNAELPSPVAGRVEALLVAEGDTVGVGTEIARLGEGVPAQPTAGSGAPAAGGTAPPAAMGAPTDGESRAPAENVGMFAGTLSALDAPLPRQTIASASTAPPAAFPPPPPPPPAMHGDDEGRRVRSSPLVRRLAEEHGVDLSQLSGSGLGGRITKDDLLGHLEQRGSGAMAAPTPAPGHAAPAAAPAAGEPVATTAAPAPPPAPPTAAPLAPPAAPAAAGPVPAPGEERVPLSPMRRSSAEHLTRVIQTTPQAWLLVEADLTRLVRWRERERAAFREREGIDLALLAPFVQVVAEALRAEPYMTARWGGDHLALRKGLHLGIAVALDDGLVVPVLHDADGRNLVGLARGLADLVTRARAGQLTLGDVQGGVFTVNNTGAFGSIVSQPIVPEGQTGIVTLEAIVKRPVVIDDAIAIRSMANVCLSFDHRVVDGATAGRFMQDVKRRLEAYPPNG